MKKSNEVKIKKWVLSKDSNAEWNGTSLLLFAGGMGSIALNKAETRKLYQKLSSLYKD